MLTCLFKLEDNFLKTVRLMLCARQSDRPRKMRVVDYDYDSHPTPSPSLSKPCGSGGNPQTSYLKHQHSSDPEDKVVCKPLYMMDHSWPPEHVSKLGEEKTTKTLLRSIVTMAE